MKERNFQHHSAVNSSIWLLSFLIALNENYTKKTPNSGDSREKKIRNYLHSPKKGIQWLPDEKHYKDDA